jgi:hypothetical protein
MRLFDSLHGTLTRAYQLQADSRRINQLVEKGELAPGKARVLQTGIDQQFRILKETVLDRTIPTLSRSEFAGMLAILPSSEKSDTVKGADAEREAVAAAFRQLCRGDIRLIEGGVAENGSSEAHG